MKTLICLFILAGLTGCQQSQPRPTDTAINRETVSPLDYQICINTLKSGDDEDAITRCEQVTKEIRSGKDNNSVN